MPHYDYVCHACGKEFELFQKMSDAPITICPYCQGEVKRLIGAGAGPIFKGSGFYQTDYKNPPASADNKSKGGNSPQKEATANTPAAKKE